MNGNDRVSDLVHALAVYANYCAMWITVGQLNGQGDVFEVEQRPDLLLIRSHLTRRVPHMILSPQPPPDDRRRWVTGLVAELARDPVSLMIGLPPGSEDDPLTGALASEGFVPATRPLLAMARTDIRAEPSAVTDDVVLARSDMELEQARALLARVFGLPPAIFAFYTPPSAVHTFSLRIGDEVAAAACLCPFAGVAGIYSVAVAPSFRGKGYAQRLVRRALHEAALLGYDTAVLSCERSLAGLYRNLGFDPVWELMSYWLEAWWR